MADVEYVMGRSTLELERLDLQAEILRGITRRLLLEAGLKQGMRVLDIGCGVGDVASLAAAIVGPSGSVVTIDQSREAIEAAKTRATAEGWTNIEFRQVAAEDFTDDDLFDFAVGRYVLVHQADPVRMIAAAAAQVRPGGVVAFHEIAVHVDAVPPMSPFLAFLMTLLARGGRSASPRSDVALAMPESFEAAGLNEARMFCEIPVGYGDSPIARWLALTVESGLPDLLAIGLISPGELDTGAIESRLREEAHRLRRPLIMPLQLCGWARRGAERRVWRGSSHGRLGGCPA